MFKSARYSAVAFALIGSALVSGCGSTEVPATASAAIPAPAAALAPLRVAPPKPVRVFTLNTPVNRIAADPDGRAILNRDVPGLMASKEYPLFDDMSLRQIAVMSRGRLTKSRLALVQTDLVQLSDLNP